MIIFPAEKNDGLEKILSTKSSITYASLVEKSNNTAKGSYNLNLKAIAGIEDKDLYYTQSILVTTSWNKNDDIFDPSEVWAAKNTPTHKPTNLEHDESVIVGHITSNYPMTEDGLLIDENTPIDNLPEKFHILTGSVIYMGYTDPELKTRAQTLIDEIENGNKYVSMECFFNGFDYGLINKKTGEFKVLSRNNETAFLTKHLRAYGGLGEHEDYKIGRVLRSITFSGKGFVNKPANPESVIFTKNSLHFDKNIATKEILKEKNSDFSEIGVFSNQANLKENIMSLELDPIVAEVAGLKAKIEAMINASATAEKVAELQNTIKAQEVLIQDAKNTIDALNADKEEAAKKKDEEMDKMKSESAEAAKKKDEEMDKVKSELAAAQEKSNEYQKKVEEMMKKAKNNQRMASLLENGVDNDTAAATVEKFDSLDDAAFEAITSLVAAVKPAKTVDGRGGGTPAKDWKMGKANDVEETKETNSEDVSAALENAEPEQSIDLSVGSESSETEANSTRAALVDFVRNRLGKKLNKGE